MEEVKELKSKIPEFNPETHKWDFKKKEVVPLTPEELAEIARKKRIYLFTRVSRYYGHICSSRAT